eukprot:scaffold220_cov169-Amphora_coffeaeformis.AAC.2
MMWLDEFVLWETEIARSEENARGRSRSRSATAYSFFNAPSSCGQAGRLLILDPDGEISFSLHAAAPFLDDYINDTDYER